MSINTGDDSFVGDSTDRTPVLSERPSHPPTSVFQEIEELPHDKKGRVRLTFALIGVATLMPWNIFITATDYWMYKFRDVNESHVDHPRVNKTELQTFFTSYLSMSSNIPFLLMLILNAIWGQKVVEHVRTLIGLTAITIIFIFTTIFVEVDTDDFQLTFFRLTLTSVVVMSCFSAIFQGSIVSIASIFPSRNMHFYATGQSAAGLYAVFAQILSLSGQFGPTTTALYYFVSADVLLIATLTAYFWLVKSEYYRYYLDRSKDERERRQAAGEIEESGLNLVSSWNTFLAVKWHALTILLVNWMTISVFPPLTVLVVPKHPNVDIWSGRFFIPITSFLMFCLADFVGRFISRHVPLSVRKPKLLLALAGLRWFFVPFLMLCNAHPRSLLPVVFESEWMFVFLVTAIGLTNGYLYIMAMINGPEFVPNELRSQTGFILVLFLGFGVALGSITSNFILRLL